MEPIKERLTIIIVSAIAIALVGIYTFLYSPLINKLRKAHLECCAIETTIFQARESIANLDKMDIKKDLVREGDVPLAIDELTRQGKAKGISFISITPKTIERAGDLRYKILPIEMEIESGYEELGAFLGLLDGLEESLATVRNFNIVSDNEKTPRLKTRLVVDMYLSGR